MAGVEAISSSFVGSINPTPNISRLNLSPWDLQLLPLDPIQKGILFHHPHPQRALILIHHLKTSLSRTLDFFPPLAGRFSTTRHHDGTTTFFVDCNNAGVQFIHAVAADTSISDIVQSQYIPKIVSAFFPLNGVPNYEGGTNPLLAVQVTELADGLFVACSANHAVVDGISFWHFFNSWSEISRGNDTISKTPVFQPWFPSNAVTTGVIPLPPVELRCDVVVPPPFLERVFHFSGESLAKLKAKANSEAGTDKISTLQALSAHLWRSVSRCRYSGKSLDGGEEVPFGMLVGARARIPLPEGYFGNAVMVAKTSTGAAELLENGIGHAAVKINELVARQTKEAMIKVMEDWVDNPTFLKKGVGFMIASSPRHNVYGNDFGWGKPIAVRSGLGQKNDGKMTLFPAAEGGGGIDVEVCLAPETMRLIGDDQEFMEALKTEDMHSATNK